MTNFLQQKWHWSHEKFQQKKRRLRAAFSLLSFLGLSATASAQIAYTQDFTSCAASSCNGWTITGGYQPNITATSGSGFSPCSGASAKANVYDWDATTNTATLTSTTSLGTSTGALATLGINYKVINYSSGAATAAGSVTYNFQSATSAAGPYVTFHSFTNASSSTCVPASATFTPIAGQPVFIRIQMSIVGTSPDVWAVVDDITLNQAAGSNCTGTPAPGNTITSAASVCAGTSFTLSLQNGTAGVGISYQWQSSPDGTTWTNVGTNSPSYSTTQTAATYFQAIVTCASTSQSGTSAPVQVAMNGFMSCYCPSTAQSGSDTDIGSVTFGTMTNGSPLPVTGNPAANGTYTNNSALPATSYVIGATYPISLHQITSGGSFYPGYFNVFIDYNHDGIFNNTTERVFSGGLTSLGSPSVSGNVIVPATALPGNTRMRVVLVEDGTNTDISCSFSDYYYGETEDYTINLVVPVVCSGTPMAGTTPGALSACPGNTLSITAVDAEVATGITYQWEQSTDGGTIWANAVGGSNATTPSYTTPVLDNTFAGMQYRIKVTCSTSGISSVTAATTISINPVAMCYCQPDYSDGTGDGDYIGRVALGSIDNITTGAPSPYYTFYSSLNTNLTAGNPYVLTLSAGTYGFSNVQAAWIDYNQNGTFESSEKLGEVTLTGPYPVTGTISFTVPAATITGATRMRVRHVYSGSGILPCSSAGYGETEDYTVTIMPAPLSGSGYTIDQTSPASPTNFVTFSSLADMLNTVGVSGPVTVNVVPTTSPYTSQQFALGVIPGASSTNTITINGNGETLTFCSNNPLNRDVVRLDGTNWLRLNDLNIVATCGYGWGIHMMNSADNNIINGNTVTVNSTSPSVSPHQGIIAVNSIGDPQAFGIAANNLQITNNTVTGGWNGIRVNGIAATPSTGLVISGNTVNDAYEYGIYVLYNNGPVVHDNAVTMRAGNSRSTGYMLNRIDNGITFTANHVMNAGRRSVYFNQINQNSTTRGLIANNMVAGGLQNTTEADGLYLNYSNYLDVYHNSTLVDNAGMGYSFCVTNWGSRYVDVQNNSFAYTGGGAGYAVAIGAGILNYTQDYNNYFSNGTKFAKMGNADRTNLLALKMVPNHGGQHDDNSMELNPGYTNNTDLHLLATSPLIGQLTNPLTLVTTDFDGQARQSVTEFGADDTQITPRAGSHELDVTVYPNPFTFDLTIAVKGMEGEVGLTLTDMMGREVYRTTTDAEAGLIKLQPEAQLAQGVYMLQVTQNGGTSQFRVVKQ